MKKIYLAMLSILTWVSPSVNAQSSTDKANDNTVTFYIARHGKTMFNTLDRVQGWSDSPLTPAGIEVAEYLGKGLKEIPFKAAYSSDLSRARQTARIVLEAKGQKELPVIEVPGVRETNFGRYEGGFNTDMWGDAALYMHYKNGNDLMKDIAGKPDMFQKILAAIKKLDTLNMAEDYNDVKKRGQQALREIAEKEASQGGGNILLVSHGMAISIFLFELDSAGKKPEVGQMENAAVSKVVYKNGQFTLESFGDMRYVEKGKALSGK
ncbi:histidine phosphatase family protein [Parabacteroides sp. PF5-9]|uniref:histidine phosphatase family protein n=1 Tax=Parabacteroides sp. PF5-9 TaxID=1742404 RepID=UPI002475F97B|nr:histidine phosphatase family protein [Parabacteroides sp. PF5-9]MDH6357883.1 broad specificity phosphatase PhoE [Parabacteroides sp. PF5-9]